MADARHDNTSYHTIHYWTSSFHRSFFTEATRRSVDAHAIERIEREAHWLFCSVGYFIIQIIFW
jgi:hypothetical protein